MKTKNLLLTTLCLLASNITATLTPDQKTDFLRVYGGFNYSGVLSMHPKNPIIEVFFFDINGDGVEEAIATSNNAVESDGVKWDVLALTKSGWERVKFIDDRASSRALTGWLFAHNSEFFALTEDGKPPQLVVIRDGGKTIRIAIDGDGFLSLYKKFPTLNLFASLGKLERLKPETYTDIPPSRQYEAMFDPPPTFFERTNLETEPWVDDPSAIPAPSNGVWNPERHRYYTDFNNDGIHDLLLGIHRDLRYELYLGNAEGKYKKYAVFHGLTNFSIESKENGMVLFWRHQWDTPTLRKGTLYFGYHTITTKGVSDYTTVKTFQKEDNGWNELRQAYSELREKSNAKELYYGLHREYSETFEGKVIWRGDYIHYVEVEDEEDTKRNEARRLSEGPRQLP